MLETDCCFCSFNFPIRDWLLLLLFLFPVKSGVVPVHFIFLLETDCCSCSFLTIFPWVPRSYLHLEHILMGSKSSLLSRILADPDSIIRGYKSLWPLREWPLHSTEWRAERGGGRHQTCFILVHFILQFSSIYKVRVYYVVHHKSYFSVG